MAPWSALNLEPESDIEDVEDDNSKEIQIEEALKLYQVALKVHSQGPRYYQEAEQAYNALFESEIFQYPESKSELARLTAITANDDFEDEGIVLASEPPGGQDTAPSTLPQILYLSFKNRGQFLLDQVIHELRIGDTSSDIAIDVFKGTITTALSLLSEALDKDPTDSDLWRRVAKLGRSLGSRRLARFALESACIDPENEEQSMIAGYSLEDLATKYDLERVLVSIDNDQTKLFGEEHRGLARSLADRFDHLSVLSDSEPLIISAALPTDQTHSLIVPSRSWESVAEAILRAHEAELEESTGSSGVYLLHLESSGDETSETPSSPVFAKSESLSKRRFSKGPVTPYKNSTQDSVTKHLSTPLLRGRNGNIALSEGQNDSSAIHDDVSVDSGIIASNIPPNSERRPSNKRSCESAGLQDTPDGGGRSRSKRLRAKAETTLDDIPDTKAINKQHEEQLGVYSRADDWVFSVAYEIGCRFGCKSMGNAESVRDAMVPDLEDSPTTPPTSGPGMAPLRDLKQALCTWNANKSSLLLNGTGVGASAVLIDDGSDSGFASFMERSKTDIRKAAASLPELVEQDLDAWFRKIKDGPVDLEQLALLWARALLEHSKSEGDGLSSIYVRYVWSAALKDSMAAVLIDFDDVIYAFAVQESERAFQDPSIPISNNEMAVGFAETVFELHVDNYAKMVAPDSKIDQPSRIAQRDRLVRWFALTSNVVGNFGEDVDERTSNHFVLRHIWAQLIYIGLVEASARDHLLVCYHDLRKLFASKGSPCIVLPNNSTMPDVSLEALDQEMSKEKTLDFFQGIFGTESKDSVTLIERLEPVLMETFGDSKTLAETGEESIEKEDGTDQILSVPTSSSTSQSPIVTPAEADQMSSGNSQLIDFLQKATLQLKLSLWHQLKGAYNRIDYPGMKIVCNFRSMILILRELHAPTYTNESQEDRTGNLIIWVRNLADLMSQTLDTIKSHAKGLDCMTEENLKMALEACALATRLFHVFALWEDSIRIGQSSHPPVPGNLNTYKNAMTFLREIQPKMWHLLYLIYKEAFSQDPNLTEAASEDLVEYLRALHCSFGNREYCRVGRKSLMKMIKTELIRLNGPEDEIAQALYDLYGLKITSNPNSIWEHGCTGDSIDRTNTLEIIGYVMSQVNNMNMKDLLKSDVRIATEKMQAVIGIPRAGAASTQQSFNRRLVTNYLKSPIAPAQFKQALEGLLGLSTMRIKTEYASVASKRWFFLIGNIHLAKYRNTKRVGPDATEDLDDAITFLKLDLDFDTSGWETWMRLGQAYDSKLDEEVLWDAVMINDKPDELTQFERHAIHCYEMAVSLAKQSADGTQETQLKLSELYADFANRLYSSTREPFRGKVFDLAAHEKYINQQDKGTYQVAAFHSLSQTSVWKICERLYQQALAERAEDDWHIWYMRGKCRWKLFQSQNETIPSWTYPVEAFVKAVEHVPEKRDSRHPEKEPVLEPHVKLLSIVRKLLKQGLIIGNKAIELLQCSHYMNKVQVNEPGDWNRYTLDLLQVLRNADKSNWHHRLISMAANIAFEDQTNQQAAAQAAKDRFSQHILTKAMAIQIWKPEYERPGRHFVYASRYLRWIISLLEELDERPVLETLGKRVRKKQNEYIDAADIFDQICEAHMRLIRKQGDIPEKSEDRVFHQGMTFEYFVLNAGRLEPWAHSQLSLTNTKLSLLSEVWELKKLSGTLLEKGPFEELMMDIYACLFETMVPELITRAGEAQNREKMRIDRMLMDSDANPAAQSSTAETAAAPSRPRQISKGEVRRRSEALVTRPTALPVKGKTVSARDASPETKTYTKSSSNRSADIRTATPDGAMVDDSADAESELSSIADSDLEDPGHSPTPNEKQEAPNPQDSVRKEDAESKSQSIDI